MSSRSCQSRVESIKKKFECSQLEGNKKVPLKNAFGQAYSSQNFRTNATVEGECTISNSNKSESKAQIKRTPAFRRDKFQCLKSVGKFHCPKNEEPTIDLIISGPFCTSTSDVIKEREPVTFGDLQRSKTDCFPVHSKNDNSNASPVKVKLVSKAVNLLGNSENVEREILTSYSVVSRNLKENKFGKAQRETDLKLSESLKKALQSPLPTGPPPKKPPRTFCHSLSNAALQNNSHDLPTTITDLPKLKLKLDKLESVIKNHDKELNKCIGTKMEGSSSKRRTSEHQFMANTSKKKNGNQTCLPLPGSCVNSCKDVYNEPIKKFETQWDGNQNSQCNKNLTHKDGQQTCVTDSNKGMRDGRVEHIYDTPHLNKGCPVQSDILKENSNANKSEGLHYLCTDVLKNLSLGEVSPLSVTGDNGVPATTSPETCPVYYKVDKSVGQGDDFERIICPHVESEMRTEIISLEETSLKSDCDSLSSADSGLNNECYSDELNSRTTRGQSGKSTGPEKECEKVSKASSELFCSVPYWKCTRENSASSHLFECCLLVGLTFESEQNVPYIKNKFPPDAKPPPLIEALCFPDASNWPLYLGFDQSEEQYYSLVVTNQNGERKFGYCRRVLPEGGNLCLPLTYCIVTPHQANGFFHKVLQELESRHGSVGMENFIKELYEAKFPGPGEGLKLKKILEDATKSSPAEKYDYLGSTLVRRPCDVRLEEKNLTQLFNHLHLQVLLKIFTSLLNERKVLLLSNSLRKLSTCIEGLQSILLPFSWQHTYIPVLPLHLIEMCEAPTPYVIGLLKTKDVDDSLANINFENGIIVDLDDSKVKKCCGDEGTIIPQRLLKALKTSLNIAINATVLPDGNRNVVISDAFIDFFVQTCGHYSKFVFIYDDQKTFEEREFIKFVSSTSIQSFLESFTKTAMFQAFIHERLHGVVEDVPVKLFSLRAMEALKASTAVPINYKVINKKVKSLGDKIKDFIQ